MLANPALRILRLAPLLLALVHLGPAPGAQTYRLNEPFRRGGIVGEVRDFRLLPGAGQVVFRADVRREGVLELYRAPLDGGARPVPVVSLPVDHSVSAYEFSPDGRWLVYLADAERSIQFELFVHEVGTHGARKLSAPLERLDQSVGRFELSADGARAVYSVGRQLFSVPLDGGGPALRLTPTGALENGAPPEFALSASGRVAFVYPASGDLYSAPVDGSPGRVQLTQGLAVHSLQLAPDGATVACLVGGSATGSLDLHAAPIDGAAPSVFLDSRAGWAGASNPVLWSPDGARIVYLKDQEIYAVAPGGGAPLKLDEPYVSNQAIHLEGIAAGSRRLVYHWFQEGLGGNGPDKLCSVPVDGSSAPTVLVGPEERPLVGARISADGRRVVFKRGALGLNSVPVEGGEAPVDLDGAWLQTRDFWITPDSARVFFVGGDPVGLHSVPIGRQATPVLVAPNAPVVLEFAPGGARVLFLDDSANPGTLELYGTSLSATPVTAKLSESLARGLTGDVVASVVDAAGERLAYVADSTVDERFDLFGVAAGGAEAAHLLDTNVWPDARTVQIGTDGVRVVYLRPLGQESFQLRSVALDGSAAPVALGALGGNPPSFVLAPDASRAVYEQGGDLYAVPLTGGPPLLLFAGFGDGPSLALTSDSRWVVATGTNGLGLFGMPLNGAPGRVLDPGAKVYEFRLTAGGLRVVYKKGEPLDGMMLSTAVDGSTTPVLLSEAQHAMSEWQLSADDRWVVFRGRPSYLLAPVDLFSRRSDGSGSLLKLDVGPGYASIHPRVLVTPDSSRAVYLAQAVANGPSFLFSVHVDGRAAPVQLTYPGAGQVAAFALTDGEAVFTKSGGSELYRVPLDGSAAPVRLSEPPAYPSFVSSFALSPDLASCVFVRDSGRTLFALALDGSRPQLQLSPPLASPGCTSFQLSPDSRRVFFQAARTSQVIELFGSVLPQTPQQRHLRRP